MNDNPIHPEMLEKIHLGIDSLIVSTVDDYFRKAGLIIDHEKIRKICFVSLSKNVNFREL